MRLEIDSRLNEIPRAIRFVDDFCERHRLAQGHAEALNVVLDEILTNSIRYGLDEVPGHPISITLDCLEGEVMVRVEDEGVAFDPTRAPAPAVGGSLAERKVGGLGLAFVRELTHSIEYQRLPGRNRLTLRRRIDAGSVALPGA
jgi:serine/threonine-protein kinase RsbW